MAQIAIMKSQFDMKSSAESYYKTFCNKQNMLPKICPDLIKDVQLVNGDWDSIGSVKSWTFVPIDESRPQISSFRTVAMDKKNKSITIEVIDGDVKKLYSLYRYTIQVTEKGNDNEGKGSTMKIILEYEKQNSHVPEPTKYFEFATVFYNTIDSYLVKNKE